MREKIPPGTGFQAMGSAHDTIRQTPTPLRTPIGRFNS